MKFNNFTYTRPNVKTLTEDMLKVIDTFEQADTFAIQSQCIDDFNELRSLFSTMLNICTIRHTIDTKNDFYEKENTFFDENSPVIQEITTKFYTALINSPFRKELEQQWQKQLFTIAELGLTTFKPIILEGLQEENRLKSEYVKLKSSAKIELDGEEYNISSIFPLEVDVNRATRKAAAKAKWNFFETNTEKFDTIYDSLVKTRHKIAQKLGYKNYIQLGYNRMLRSDYTPEMIANFRAQVLEHVVPFVTELYERQAKRIGVSDFKYYDIGFKYKSGNPTPKGEPDWIVNHAKSMYKELSPETEEFFNYMLDNELMDLVTRDNKAPGGYCTYIPDYQAPYIYSNFNGTSHDIDVLTHEAGHAFQVYSSRNFKVPEYNFPTYEACEIHSMSMEFFTWPFMEKFFEEDTQKYKYAHLVNALMFLSYGVTVDEFQHVVYENPNMTTEERNKAWREIEQKYEPYKDYADNNHLKKGTFWQKQGHIFEVPFYYIDYCLAQTCAFQFWSKSQKEPQQAWADYVQLCKAGGSKSFLELVDYANLRSPFEDGLLEDIITEIKAWLNDVDDSKF